MVTLVPLESFVKPVEGDDDLFTFVAGGKALTDESITVEDNGDLILEGYAAVWEGEDREGENFIPGAFQRATKAFLSHSAPLCFHHKRDHVLGKVLDLKEDDKGLKIRARVDGATQQHPVLGTLYHQIKNGTLQGLSVGGLFQRSVVDGRPRISDMDFTEISVTGIPIHTGPSFAVVAGKALMDDVKIPEVPEVEGEVREDDVRQVEFLLEELSSVFSRIEALNRNRKQQTAA